MFEVGSVFLMLSTSGNAMEKDKQTKSSVYATAQASYLERETQFQKYHNDKAGHGFAAEDADAWA